MTGYCKSVLATMQKQVVGLVLANYEIAIAVVRAILIDMMDNGLRRQCMSQYFLHDEDMLKFPFPILSLSHVAKPRFVG